jgi:uncharacterized membrane protein
MIRTSLKHWFLTASTILAWYAVSLYAPTSILKIAVSSIFLLTVPGFLLLKLLIRDDWPSKFWETLMYSTGLSILALMVSGLAINTILPVFGIAHPLTLAPLANSLGIELLIAATVVAARRRSFLPEFHFPRLNGPELTVSTIATAIPVLSALGAISLNNGSTNIFSQIMLATVAGLAIVLSWPKGNRYHNAYIYCLFMMSLGLLLSTSLRGWFITGHDVMQEYQVFQLTIQHGLWNMSFFRDPYNACLSITILPTILATLTGISDAYVYKILSQLIFALVPCAIFLLMIRYAPRRAAFLGALVFITFPTFMVDMPMLTRQETAFLFFTLAFMALFDSRLRRVAKSSLVLLLFAGMIFSHYSTSYVAIAVIIVAKMLEEVIKLWVRLHPGRSAHRSVWMPLSWAVVAVLVLSAYLWNSQVTKTGQGIAQTIAGITTSIPQLIDHQTTKDPRSTSLIGPQATDQQLYNAYLSTVDQTRDLPSSAYYPASLTNKYVPSLAQETIDPLTPIGQMLTKVKIPIYLTLDLSKTAYAAILEGLIVVGCLIIATRPKLAKVPRQFLLVSTAFLMVVVLQVVLPSTVIDYGLLRLIQQGLIFLALPVVVACYVIAGWLRIPAEVRLRVVGVGLAGFFALLSGLIPAITGGYKPVLANSNSGFYYDAYYTHADEVAGFNWLDKNAPLGSIVNGDDFTKRKMVTYAGIDPRAAMVPSMIAQDAYVFYSYADSTTNKIPIYIGPSLLYETLPTAFVQANKNELYTNGSVSIYK